MKPNPLKSLATSLANKEVLLPHLRTFLLAEQAAIAAGKTSHTKIVMQDAKMTIECFKERHDEYNHGRKHEGEFFHPSRLGACMRQVFMSHFCEEAEDKTGDTLLREWMIFETGTYLGVFFQNLCERAGCLVKREAPIKNPKLRIIGHADGIVKIRDVTYVLELKTINERGYATTNSPKPDHIRQVHAYMRGLKIYKTIIIYINKNTGQLKEFVIDFDEKVYEWQVKARINYYFNRIRKKQLPPREGANANAFPCTFCSFQRECWETATLNSWMKKNKVTHASLPIPMAPLASASAL